MRVTRVLVAALVCLLAGAAAYAGPSEIRLRARLTGDAIRGLAPGGHGDFRDDGTRQRLSVEIEDVNCVGVRLRVLVNGETVGFIRVNRFRGGDLNLDTTDGEDVPAVEVGDRVVVRDNLAGDCTGTSRKAVLRGTFRER